MKVSFDSDDCDGSIDSLHEWEDWEGFSELEDDEESVICSHNSKVWTIINIRIFV